MRSQHAGGMCSASRAAGVGRTGRRRQRLGALDRQHIGQPAALQPAAQRRVAAVDLIGGHPAGRHPGIQRAFQHHPGQLRLGGKGARGGHPGGVAALSVGQPPPGQVQLTVDHPVPGRGGIRQVDGDLGVVDLAGGPGVLALHPDRAGALLEVPGLVDHQHRGRVAEVVDQVVAHVVADRVVVPDRPGQQVLHAVWGGIPSVLGDRPAVLARQVSQQPEHEPPGPPPRLHPAEPARHPAQQLLQPHLPAGGINPYAVASGHRLIVGCSHNTMIDGGRPRPLPGPAP